MSWGMRIAWLGFALASLAFARTEIKGEYSGFLKAEGSPYLVTETIVVPEGKALLIESGVVLEFASGAGIDVQGGSFVADGSTQKPVVMQAAPGYASWNGISMTGQHSAALQNVEIRDAEVGIAIENGVLDLKNVLIEKTAQIALYARAASVNAQWSKFRFNRWGRDKIVRGLRLKGISDDNISLALEELKPDEAVATLKELLRAKARNLKYKDHYDRYAKLIRFALSRGFSMDDAGRCIRELDDLDDEE